MHYIVTSDQDVTIDGIGLLTGGEPREISPDEQLMFQNLHGVTLAKANFAPSVSVQFVVDETNEEVKK